MEMVLGAENTPRDSTPLRVAGAATLATTDAVTGTLLASSSSPSAPAAVEAAVR